MNFRFGLTVRRGSFMWAVIALPLLARTPLSPGQGNGPAAGPTASPAKGTLGERYVDGSFGFAVRPPAGCATLREKQFTSSTTVELVRFVNPADQWSLAVRQSRPIRPLDAEMIAEGLTEDLRSRYEKVEVTRFEQVRIASREGVRYSATFLAEGTPFCSRSAVIRTKPTEYFTLTLLAPQGDREVATPLFDKVVASFELLRSEVKEEQIRSALERGAKLLQSVARAGIIPAQGTNEDSFLRCIADGREIGFLHIRERAKTIGHRRGLEINKQTWLFQPDGGITHMWHNMFLAGDLSHEMWESRVLIISPPPRDGPREAALNVESAIRQDDKLLVAYTPEPNAPKLSEKVIEVESSYASAPWDLLLPRLVDLDEPQLYAFSSYDGGRRGLALRTFRVVGPTRVVIGAQSAAAIKLEDSEGLVPPFHELYVDKTGRILRVVLRIKGKPFEMVASTREYVERHFGDQLEKAEALLQKHQVPEPTPAGKKKR